MKVLELLDELEDIIESSPGFPLTGKLFVDGGDILEIIKEIRVELPDEIQQAQWIKDERQRILNEAQKEYDILIKEAKAHAEALIENDDLTNKARLRAEEILKSAENSAKALKMSTFEYIDGILYNFQEKMEQLNSVYFEEMYNNLHKSFSQINATLANNRNEIRELMYKTQSDADE